MGLQPHPRRLAVPGRIGAFLAFMVLASDAPAAKVILADFNPDFDLDSLHKTDVRLALMPPAHGKPGGLLVESGHEDRWPGISLEAPAGIWDLSGCESVSMNVRNWDRCALVIGLRLDNEGGNGYYHSSQQLFKVRPGKSLTVTMPIKRRLPADYGLFGMRGYPEIDGPYSAGERNLDPAAVTKLIVFVDRPRRDHKFEIAAVRATGETPPLPDISGLFPFIDKFGQNMRKDWPCKTRSEEDLAAQRACEDEDLFKRRAPKGWNKWGGWERGPRLAPTGFFYPAKYGGKWWLVDPEGRLFFSHGIDCVNNWAETIVTGREHWYEDLPLDEPEFRDFSWEGRSRGNSRWKGERVRFYNFASANAYRKFGADWRAITAERAHLRLRSWGMNTIGNWSSGEIRRMRRTPYTVAVHLGGPGLEGGEGHRADFRDVFDPACRQAFFERMERERDSTANDPYCLGYFIDNELRWGGDLNLALAALAAPPDKFSKRKFIEILEAKYRDIAALNEVWGTAHESFAALLESRTPPDEKKAREDLTAFAVLFAERYFRDCRDAVKAVAPNNLYLGCRFAGWAPETAARAAAKYCDVVTYNLYWRDVAGFKLPEGVDRPALVGEFHFGALDRGMLHTGLQGVENQKERGKAYANYVTGALRNPQLVGTHWFQYIDQATTGRSDGENYQIGFVDICDAPYTETIAACRKVGYRLYKIRK